MINIPGVSKKYLIISIVIIVSVAVMCLLKCATSSNKESFTDLKNKGKNVLIINNKGDLEPYKVNDILDQSRAELIKLEDKINATISTLKKSLEDTDSIAKDNRSRLNTHLPKGLNQLKLNNKVMNDLHIDLLNGKRDIWIANLKHDAERKYLQAVSNRDTARFYGNKEQKDTLNPRFRLYTFGSQLT